MYIHDLCSVTEHAIFSFPISQKRRQNVIQPIHDLLGVMERSGNFPVMQISNMAKQDQEPAPPGDQRIKPKSFQFGGLAKVNILISDH